ncbi:MAG: MFS transporter [Candidatus Binatia bacterium]
MYHRALLVLSLAVFATMAGNSMVIPFLPLYVHQFGVSEFGAGLLFSVHAATRTVILPFVGRLSDRWERKVFLVFGVLCYTIASLAYLPAGTLTAFILVMLLHGTATAVVHPIAMAYVGDIAPKGQEGAYSGYMNTAFLGGIGGGPLLGGIIKDWWGMEANFFAMAGASLLALILMLFFLPHVERHKTIGPSATASQWTLLTVPPIAGVAGFRLGYAMANALTWVFLPLLATHMLPLNTTQVGLLVSVNVIVSTLLQAPSGRLADRMNKAHLIGLGGLLSAIALLGFPWASGFWQLFFLNILVGAAYGLAFPAHIALAMEQSRGYGMGTVMSLLMFAHGIGMMIGPALFGAIARQWDIGGAFWSGGLLNIVLILLCYPLTKMVASPSQAATLKKQEPVVSD